MGGVVLVARRPLGALRTLRLIHIETRRLGRRRAGQEEVLLALGALQKQTVAHLEKGQISEAVPVGVVSNVGDVSEISQRETDHVDGQNLPAFGVSAGPATGGWLPVQGGSERHPDRSVRETVYISNSFVLRVFFFFFSFFNSLLSPTKIPQEVVKFKSSIPSVEKTHTRKERMVID